MDQQPSEIPKITRRKFIQISLLTGISQLIAACAPKGSLSEDYHFKEVATAQAERENNPELAKAIDSEVKQVPNVWDRSVRLTPYTSFTDISAGTGAILVETEKFIAILTAGHNVDQWTNGVRIDQPHLGDDGCQINAVNPVFGYDGTTPTLEIFESADGADVALLFIIKPPLKQGNRPDQPPLVPAPQLELNEPVYGIEFPVTGNTAPERFAVIGIVTELPDLTEGYSANTFIKVKIDGSKGASGTVLFNRQGQMIGILSQTDPYDDTAVRIVPIQIYVNMLEGALAQLQAELLKPQP